LSTVIVITTVGVSASMPPLSYVSSSRNTDSQFALNVFENPEGGGPTVLL